MPDPSVARERFFEVAAQANLVRIVDDREPVMASPEQMVWSEMHEWAKRPDTARYVALMVARKMEYRYLENANIDNHARLAYYKAYRDFCELVEEEIQKWASDTPPISGGPARQGEHDAGHTR